MKKGLHNFWTFLIIAILSGAIYSNSFNNSFHYDDDHHIKLNTYLESWENVPQLFVHPEYYSAMTGFQHYRPLLYVTYLINKKLHGNDPWGYHLVNLLFHIGSSFLIFLILQAMLGGNEQLTVRVSRDRSSGLSSPATFFFIAFMAALIFAVHPFNTEVINYITARSSVMSGFFYLLAFYFWVKYRTGKDIGRGRDVGKLRLPPFFTFTSTFYIASLFAFLLGMLTKEVVITLPVMLLVYDFYFFHPSTSHRRGRIKWFWPYIPFIFVVVMPYIVIRMLFWGTYTGVVKRDVIAHVYTEMIVLVKYIIFLFLPVGLTVDHNMAIYKEFTLPVAGSILFLLSLIGIGVWLYKSKRVEWRVLSFFIGWFFIVLLPTTIVQLDTLLQENRGYLAGVACVVVAGIMMGKMTLVSPRFKDYSGFSRGSIQPLTIRSPLHVYIFLFAIVLTLSAAAYMRNNVWKSSVSLWEDAVRKSPASARAHTNLGLHYYEAKDVERAIKEFNTAIRLDPKGPFAYNNLGHIYIEMEKWELAEYWMKKAIEIDPWYTRAYDNLGFIYFKSKKYDLAIKQFNKAISTNPEDPYSHLYMGIIYQNWGRDDIALELFQKALEFANRTGYKNIAQKAQSRLARYESEIDK